MIIAAIASTDRGGQPSFAIGTGKSPVLCRRSQRRLSSAILSSQGFPLLP